MLDTNTTNLIKIKNMDLIRKELKRVKVATKPQLAEITGISLVTVNSLIKDLVLSGEVLEDTIVQPQLGRPAISYRYNSEYKLALLIFIHEIGRQDIANFLICNLYGDKMAVFKKSFNMITKDSFDSTIEEILSSYTNIEIIGFGLPAVEIKGKLSVSDYDALLNVDFRAYIENKFQRPVFIENDINAATFGYCCSKISNKDICVIGLYFPYKYAPGAGIYRNGELIKGRDGLAGDIRYLPFDIDWEQFDFDEDTINQLITKVIKIFMCLYNPDKIMLYRENNSYNFASNVEKNCMTDIEKVLIPEIIYSDSLNSDFENGMIHLALEQLK